MEPTTKRRRTAALSKTLVGAIRLAFMDGMGCREIADMFGLPPSTVERQILELVDQKPRAEPNRGACPECGSFLWPCMVCAARAARRKRGRSGSVNDDPPADGLELQGEDYARYRDMVESWPFRPENPR